MMKLYDYFRSSAAFRVRIALNLKGLSYESIPIHLLNQGGEQHTATYRKINPQGLVPTLETDGMLLTQSLAIIEYLDELHPTPALLPADPYQKALVRAFALSIAADIHPLGNLRVLQYLTHAFSISEDQKKQWILHWVNKGLTALEEQLQARDVRSDFCFGNQPSLADICLVPQLFNARRFNCDLNLYPTLVKIDGNCQQLSAVKQAWPVEAVT